MVIIVNVSNNKPCLTLFPDGMLFPCNPDSLFSEASGKGSLVIKKALIGSFVIFDDFNLLEITDVRILSNSVTGWKRIQNLVIRKVKFDIITQIVLTDKEQVIEKIKQSMSNHLNKENINLRVSYDQFIKVSNLEDLYNSFEFPALIDCLDTL